MKRTGDPKLILDQILADKRLEVADRKIKRPQRELEAAARDLPAARDFLPVRQSAIRNPKSQIALIAEVKKASPSKGLIRPDFDPVEIAKTYEAAGASAISVLTDEKYFQGRLEYLTAVHDAVSLPILRKDFIIDPYQVYEARAAKADAVLLIVAALPIEQLKDLTALATELGMASLVEAHSPEELNTALEIGAKIIGINNRNLHTFEVKLETTLELASRVPGDRILVSESGIFTRSDVERLMAAGVDAILVGESLMREPDPGVKVRELLGRAMR
jgi:indole-3-glycerol phosphate synthase